MPRDKSTIRISLRTDKPNKNNSIPVVLVYQIRSQKKNYWISCVTLPGVTGTDDKLFSPNWDREKQRAKYVDKKDAKKYIKSGVEMLTNIEVEEINERIEEKIKEIKNIEKRFTLDQVQYSAQMVMDKLKSEQVGATKKEQPGTYIVDFIEKYAKECETTHKYRTIQVYLGLSTHLKDYETLSGTRATFEKLDIQFLRGFTAYLTKKKTIKLRNGKDRTVAGMNNITIAKQISTLKTLLKAARTVYGIESNPAYLDFKVQRKDAGLEVITLTMDEFKRVYELDLKDSPTLDRVRDVFCFACVTGLRYSDLVQLKREHIHFGVITMTASKTMQRLEIPLNPYSQAILEKYQHHHNPLPIISGQKTNQYLKDIGKLAEIDTPIEKVRERGIEKKKVSAPKYKFISIHMGRRTFTTLSLEMGMAAQEVMAFTGHTTYKSFKRYVEITNERKKAVMAKAWGEYKEENKLKRV